MIDQIMKLETARRITPLRSRVSDQEARINAWNQFQGLASKLRTSASGLKDGSAFGAFKADATVGPSGRALLSASASATATPGSYRVEVIELAKADKVSGTAVADAASALGFSGEIVVNGRAVSIAAGDSLSAIRDRINAANSGTNPSGVTATILSTSSTSNTLVLTADQTGSRGIELVDSANSGGVLEQLGVLSTGRGANVSPSDGRAQSQRFSDTTSRLATMLGVTAPPAVTTVEVNGKKVTVDLLNDTMISLLNKVASAGESASIVDEQVGSRTLKRLAVTGSVSADAAASDPVASQRIVELLGFQKAGTSSVLAQGADAKFRVDGLTLTRRSNTVTDAIGGVTLNLLASDAAQRTSSLAGAAAGLSLLTDPRTIDAGTYGIRLTVTDSTTRSTSTSSAALSVTTAPMSVAAGSYAMDSVVTRSASASAASILATDAPSTVAAGTYALAVTQAATRSGASGAAKAGTGAYTGATGDSISIVDNVSGVTGKYDLTAGQTLDSVILGLNNLFASRGMKMTASNDTGKLRLQHQDFGSAASFTVASSNNTVSSFYGTTLMTTAGSTHKTGVDVQGSFTGPGSVVYTATGQGQTLTATNGLKVQYTAATVGSNVGTVTLTDTVSGRIGGYNATWDSGSQSFTGAAGTPVAGLQVRYTGAFGPGTLGSPTTSNLGTVTLTDSGGKSISGVTIGSVAGVWDATSRTIRGAAGTAFEGLELQYTGAAVAGSVGDLVVSGEIGVDLTIGRDVDASVEKVKEFATAYSDLRAFVQNQRTANGPLGTDAALRSAMGTITNQLLSEASGVTGAYTRTAQVGVALTREGRLEVDTTKLRSLIEANPNDVQSFFRTFGEQIHSSASRIDQATTGTAANQVDSLNRSIDRIRSRVLRAEALLDVRRDRLTREFSAMEEALGKIQSQGSWLFSQLGGLQQR